MDDAPQPVDAKTLRFLRLLVTVLTVTMILGFLVIVTLFVIKFSGSPRPDPLALPAAITLPAGVNATAFTRAKGWYGVVTDDNRILIYSPKTGALLQEIEVTAGK
jgi:hypothetical protein